jgi:hypothetical protein
MSSVIQRSAGDEKLQAWCEQLATLSVQTKCLTVGITSGHREANDARAIYRIASALDDALVQLSSQPKLLLCRLEVHKSSLAISLLGDSSQQADPTVRKSALGRWNQIDIDIRLGSTLPKQLSQIPRWLPKWKMAYDLILIDLGSMHLVPSRTVGRLCDAVFVMLGPNTCASAHWILEQVDLHQQAGCHIAGTLVANVA